MLQKSTLQTKVHPQVNTMRLTVILLLASLLQLLHAAAIEEEHKWTLRDTEDDDADAGLGSGEESRNENSWVRYINSSGDVHLATVDEADGLRQYVSTRPDIFTAGPKARLESYAGEQMEDGPVKVDTVERVNPRPTAEREEGLPVAGTVLDVVASANFYPEFAIGILENGCSAFLIGPRHALTAAHCVYNFNTSSFSAGLNLWRGRNVEAYLESMTWSEVIMPHKYFVSAAEEDDWALIIYSKPSSSPVWLKIGFSENIYNVPYTLFGYPSSNAYGVMYSTVCRSLAEGSTMQTNDQLLNVQCGSDECFEGGPLLRGYNFQHSKMPVVYGIALSSCASYSFSHNNVVFQPDLFWSLCYFMSQSGFNAQCTLKDR